MPHLRVIGQLGQSYIVTEGEQGMYLIDQHAAHERILLERMVATLKARTPFSQLLLTPIELLRVVPMPEAERLSSLSEDTIIRRYPDKVVKLSKRRNGMRQIDALMLGSSEKI